MKTDGYSIGQIEALIEKAERYHGRAVPPAIARKLIREKYKSTGIKQVYPLIPKGDRADVVGTITNINLQVNLFRRLKLDDGPIGKGFLGKHAKTEYVELTIRTNTDDDTGLVGEIECLYPAEKARLERLKAGLGVIAQVRSSKLADGRVLWICSELQIKTL